MIAEVHFKTDGFSSPRSPRFVETQHTSVEAFKRAIDQAGSVDGQWVCWRFTQHGAGLKREIFGTKMMTLEAATAARVAPVGPPGFVRLQAMEGDER